MIRIVFGAVIMLGVALSGQAQDFKNKVEPDRRIFPERKIPLLDTAVKRIQVVPFDSLPGKVQPVPIPNAYDKTEKQQATVLQYRTPVKKLSGQNSVIMPGTGLLDSIAVEEQPRDIIRRKPDNR